jgi:site-specific DNA-adenine methylase
MQCGIIAKRGEIMFYYYGRKKRLVNLYPQPVFNTIIEPFAGSAPYSLKWGESRRVIIIEKDLQVYELWKTLQKTSPEDMLNKSSLYPGEKTSDFLHILHSASKRAFDYKTITVTKVLSTNWNCNKKQMAKEIPKISGWDILCGDYTDSPDIEATWFIDPPYQGDAGTGYRFGSSQINYKNLSDWILTRKGQVIVCGSPNDTWLGFETLTTQRSINGKVNQEGVFLINN